MFLCNTWLALEKGVGRSELVLPVATEDELRSMTLAFRRGVRQRLNDDHLWVSLLCKEPRSRFTRLQRLSCCLAVLFRSVSAALIKSIYSTHAN